MLAWDSFGERFSFILREDKCLVSAADTVAQSCVKTSLFQVWPGPAAWAHLGLGRNAVLACPRPAEAEPHFNFIPGVVHAPQVCRARL